MVNSYIIIDYIVPNKNNKLIFNGYSLASKHEFNDGDRFYKVLEKYKNMITITLFKTK